MKHYFVCGQPTEDGTLCQRSVSYLANDCGVHAIPSSHWSAADLPSSPTSHGDLSAEPSTVDFDQDSPLAVSAHNFKPAWGGSQRS